MCETYGSCFVCGRCGIAAARLNIARSKAVVCFGGTAFALELSVAAACDSSWHTKRKLSWLKLPTWLLLTTVTLNFGSDGSFEGYRPTQDLESSQPGRFRSGVRSGTGAKGGSSPSAGDEAPPLLIKRTLGSAIVLERFF